MSDYMVRATAADGQIRAFAITSKEMTEEARVRHNSSPIVTAALGRAMSAAAMMGSMMKGEKDLLTLQIQGDGPMHGLTVTANANGGVKGYPGVADVILPPNAAGKLNVGGAIGNGVLSASGETKLPLIYLSIAGVLNVLLNLFFVIQCNMVAGGVAIASVIAQYVSAILVVSHLCRRKDSCRLYFSRLRFHKEAAKSVLMLGVPGGMQNAIFAIANLFVQTGVSGNSAAINADTLIFNIMTAFYTACASFMGQNMGAGNRERMIKSYRISLLYSFLAGAIFGGLLVVFGRQFLSLFASKPEVIEAGMERIKIMGFSYALSAFMDCTIAASRGIGKSIVPTIIVIMGSCVFRVIWVYTIFAYFGTIASLYLLYAFSWSITAIAEIIYFKVCFRKLRIAA